MKRGWIICVVVCLLAAAAVTVAMRWPRTVPLAQCSEVYRQFVDHRDIKASYIKDFKVDDSLSVDVTLLQATTDSAWFALGKVLRAFKPEDSAISEHENKVSFSRADKNDVARYANQSYEDQYCRVVWYNSRQIYYFEAQSEEDENRIAAYFVHKLSQF